MLDTTVYIHRLQNRVPPPLKDFIDSRKIIHSSVALSELSITLGLLDPDHPATETTRALLVHLLQSIRLSDARSPTPASVVQAGTLAGMLARTQLGLSRPKKSLSADQECCQRGQRRALFHDALIFLTAREQGAVLVSSNVADMDLLLRFHADAAVLLYRQ